MDVGVCRVRSAASVTVDPLEPVLSAMAGNEILQIIGGRDALALGCPQEILHDRVRIVTKRNFDWALEAVDIAVVAGSLIGFMLSHERNELLRCPALSLEVVIIGSRCTGVHHKAKNTNEQLTSWDDTAALATYLMDEPPPKTWAAGTIARRPASHSDGLE